MLLDQVPQGVGEETGGRQYQTSYREQKLSLKACTAEVGIQMVSTGLLCTQVLLTFFWLESCLHQEAVLVAVYMQVPSPN